LEFLQTSHDWKDVRIAVFDAPQIPEQKYTQRLQYLEKRTQLLQELLTLTGLAKDHPILSMVKPIVCQNEGHLNAYFQQLSQEDPTAEEVVLRDPSAWYFHPDSFFIKKVLPSSLLHLPFYR
jgi:hypothetical protein